MGLLSIFKKNSDEDYLNKISQLEEIIKSKEKEIANLVNEVESFNKFTPRQLEVFEKNLKENREEIQKLKKYLNAYCIPYNTKEKYTYKIEVERFFSSSRFQELNRTLEENNILYLQDLNLDILEKFSGKVKNIDDAKKRYGEFLNKKMSWDIVTQLNKGERISKIYSKSRKFINILGDEYLEFMDDIKNYDFDSLFEYGFTEEQIKEFREKRDEYYLEKRVVK
ncbi:MAG: hypothetical protein Q4B33_07695 [Fusobacterium sp.]|nr:hypothetical protein [Fusobacterium sp.]